MRVRSKAVLGLLVALLAAAPLAAQGGPTVLQFSFSNPGARSLGMAGAFAALADDATAAFANPAGLVQLTRPEVSIEGRYWDYATPFVEGGRVRGEATGIGLDGPIRTAESEYDTTAVSFLSLVYPSRRWTLALYRHQLADYEAAFETQGVYTDDTVDDPQPACIPGTTSCRYPDFRQSIATDILSTSVSVAFSLEDAFSLGLAVSYFEGDFAVRGSQHLVSDATTRGFFGPNLYPPEGLIGTTLVGGEDSDWGFSAGFLWFLSRQWSFGGFYRSGPQLETSGEVRSGPALDPPIPTGSVAASEPSIPLELPAVYGLGLAYRSPNGSWTASFEWDNVEYSSILENISTSEVLNTEFVSIDDAEELRFGAEYVFRGLTPIVALRAGTWLDPDHQIRSFEDDPLERALLRRGEDEWHYALGVGTVFKHLQVDLAIDLSDLVDTASLSVIYGF
jgi:long-subunit fatty acid transport protein